MRVLEDKALGGGAIHGLFLPQQPQKGFSLLLAIFLVLFVRRHGEIAFPVGPVESATGDDGG